MTGSSALLVFILSVEPGSAAERVGLVGVQRTRRGILPGDVIVALNSRPVSRLGDLLARLDDFQVGQKVQLTLLRAGEERNVSVELQPGI